MNERFIELANEANKDIGYVFDLEEAKQLHELMGKFAELVVQKCTEIITAGKIGYNQVPAEVALDLTTKNVKAYFGVEE